MRYNTCAYCGEDSGRYELCRDCYQMAKDEIIIKNDAFLQCYIFSLSYLLLFKIFYLDFLHTFLQQRIYYFHEMSILSSHTFPFKFLVG